MAKPLYTPVSNLRDPEDISGANCYASFEKSVFLRTVQRQQGEDQAPFRTALVELREIKVSVPSWGLLSTRCAVKLPPDVVSGFATALRIYPKRAQVDKYNHQHMIRLESAVLQVPATHDGAGASKVKSDIAGGLHAKLALCVECRVMLTRNL